MHRQHDGSSTDVLHDSVVVAREPGQVLLIAEQDVRLEAVLVVRVDAGAHARVLAHPVAGVDVYYGAHQV